MCFGIEDVVIERNAILVCKNEIQVFQGFSKEETAQPDQYILCINLSCNLPFLKVLYSSWNLIYIINASETSIGLCIALNTKIQVPGEILIPLVSSQAVVIKDALQCLRAKIVNGIFNLKCSLNRSLSLLLTGIACFLDVQFIFKELVQFCLQCFVLRRPTPAFRCYICFGLFPCFNARCKESICKFFILLLFGLILGLRDTQEDVAWPEADLQKCLVKTACIQCIRSYQFLR